MHDGAAASVWLVDKPAGPTSHDVVARIRAGVGRSVRVGHAGTLDPFATGLLVVLVGRATRLARFLSGLDKTYEAQIGFGFTSTTGDPEGSITKAGEPPGREEVAALMARFRGEQEQTVPSFAAVKVDGERLYRRARRGEEVAAPTRTVRIHELELRDGPDPSGRATIHARVSSGTYIRQLAADLGAAAGCGAYCTALRRTKVGSDLGVEDACAPEEVRIEGGVGLERALGHLPAHRLSPSEAEMVAHGRPLESDDDRPEVALVSDAGLVAIARGGDGRLQPIVVLA